MGFRSRSRTPVKRRVSPSRSRSPMMKGKNATKTNTSQGQIQNRLLNLAQYETVVDDKNDREKELDDTPKVKAKKQKKSKKSKKKKKKKKYSSSSDSESSDSEEESDSDSSSSTPKKKKKKKDKKKKKKGTKSVEDLSISELEEAAKARNKRLAEERKRKAPMTKEEWEKQQSVIRREFDEDTGRVRLVKGTGEILEEIVSRDRQKEINKQATLADGDSFSRDVKSRLGARSRL